MQGDALLGGRFTMVAELGTSDAAVAYAVQDRTQCPHLLEVIRPELNFDLASWTRCQEQAKGANDLKSRLFAHLIEAGMDAEQGTYLLRESVPRVSLAARVKKLGPLNIDQTLALFERLAVGLEEAHRAGIVHRGLGPWCIMVGEGSFIETVRIAELGIAHLRAAVPRPWPGPTGWIGLAQAEGAPPSPLMDVQALALVAFFALAGQPLYASLADDTPNPDVILAEMYAPPSASKRAQELGVSLPASLDAVITRAASPQVTNSYATPTELVRALESALRPKKLGFGSIRPSQGPAAAASHSPPAVPRGPAPAKPHARTLLGIGMSVEGKPPEVLSGKSPETAAGAGKPPASSAANLRRTLLGVGVPNPASSGSPAAPGPPPIDPPPPGVPVDAPGSELPSDDAWDAPAPPVEAMPQAAVAQPPPLVSQIPPGPVSFSAPAKPIRKRSLGVWLAASIVAMLGVIGLAAVAGLLLWLWPRSVEPTVVRPAQSQALATISPSAMPAPATSGSAGMGPAEPPKLAGSSDAVSADAGPAGANDEPPAPAVAAVTLTCKPSCSELDRITCDDKPQELKDGVRLELEPGKHRCVLAKQGYRSQTLQLELKPAEQRLESVVLARLRPEGNQGSKRPCGTFINPCN